MLALILCTVTVASAVAQEEGIHASYLLGSSTFTQHEPVQMTFELVNYSPQTIRVDLGVHRTTNFVLTLTTPDGRRERLADKPLTESIARKGITDVKPGARLSQPVLLNERIQLTRVGAYRLDVRLRSPITTSEGVKLVDLPSDTIQFEILPRNEARLTEVCERLLKEATSASSINDVENAALALAHVQDDVAVPYLEDALRAGNSSGRTLAAGLVQMADAEAARALVSVFADVSRESPPPGSWNNTRAIVLRQALESIEGRIAGPAAKQEIGHALRGDDRP